MRILLCSTSDFSTDYRLHKLALTLHSWGYAPFLVGRKRRDYAGTTPLNHHHFSMWFEKGPLFYIEFNLRLFLFLLRTPHSGVVAVDLDALPGAIAAKLLTRKPVVFDSHEYFPEVPELQHRKWKKKIWQLTERVVVPRINLGITVCQSIANLYLNQYQKKFVVVRNIPLANRSAASDKPVQKAGHFTLLYQGAVNQGRGLRETLYALLHLPEVQLWVVGDGDSLPEIRRLTDQLGLQSQVTFFGKQPFEALTPFMRGAHVGLCLLENRGLNYYYALPNRVFDFINCSLPILAIDFPEMARIITPHEIGVCVPDLQTATLVEAISRLQSNELLLEKYRLNMTRLNPLFSWEKEVEPLQHLLKACLGQMVEPIGG